MSAAWRVKMNNDSSPPGKPHKLMPADFFWPITHRVIGVWAGQLSCQQCHWIIFASRIVRGWAAGRQLKTGGIIVSDWQINRYQCGNAANINSPACSGSGSPPGPWENRGVKLHLFSVSVPRGIKGEDISSHPAWLGLTHLRDAFSPHSLWALFTHPGDVACGTVAAYSLPEQHKKWGVEEAVLVGRKAAGRTNSTLV